MFVLYIFGVIRFLLVIFINYGKYFGIISKNILSLFMIWDELVRVDLFIIVLLEVLYIFLEL